MGIFDKLFKKKKSAKIAKPQERTQPIPISYKNLFGRVLEQHNLEMDHRGALAEFERGCSEQPETAEKLFWFGNLQYTIGGILKDVDYIDKAIATFEKVLQLRPNYPQVYSNLIGAHQTKGNTEGVLSVAKKWLEIDPNNETAKAIVASPVAEQHETMKQALQRDKTAKEAARQMFAPWTSGGFCDVCSEPLRTGAAFEIPVDAFYSSPKYKDWYNRKHMPFARAMGMSSDFTVDMALADMRSKDPTPYSAVCDKCVELFL